MTSEDAITSGGLNSLSRPGKKKRSRITFPEDNTDLQQKTQESKTHNSTDFRKQSPLATSPAYIGLNLTREHAVTSVLTRILPIPKNCVRTFADKLDAVKDVSVIVSEYRSGFVLGYAHITSALLGRHAVHSAFSGTAADVCEVTWAKFGEFSKNLFANMPGFVKSHQNGTTFPSGLGADIVRLLDGCAHQHLLPSPVTVASNWHELMSARQQLPSMHHVVTRQQGGFGVHGSLRRPPGMLEDPPAPKRPRPGVALRRVAEQGGFISRHGAEQPSNGVRGRHTIPPAILAVLGDAPAMQERPTARKRLVELSFEEYLDVYGRIEEEWHRRQLKQAYINSGLHAKGAGQVA